MSDLALLLEEIEALQSVISSMIYEAKRKGNIEKLLEIAKALDEVLNVTVA